MYFFFDYIFFRAYSFYKNKNSDIPIDRGIQLLSIIQVCLVLDIVMISDFCFDIINRPAINKYVLGLPVSVIIIVINEIRYKRIGKKNQFGLFYDMWGNENSIKRKRLGILIVSLPVILLFGVPVMLWGIKRFL
jgi:hypothetical protein